MDLKPVFENHLAQSTSFLPIQLEIETAEGIYLYDRQGKKYIDLISGVAVNNLGHRHPAILEAIRIQSQKYLHLMVYGEFVQKETLLLAEKLASLLPPELSVSFFVNSGSEAIEGAIKTARLYTKRNEVISFQGSYHGSTLATLNLLGDEIYKRPFRPLVPGFKLLKFNDTNSLAHITEKTSCVIMETIQTASGMRVGELEFLIKVRNRCKETGALLILDEIQTALGRTGQMFSFETFRIKPDILCLAKSLGGGLPIGAFIASNTIMNALKNGHPLLGHATTFGGHPLSCAAALATLEVLIKENFISEIPEKEMLFRKLLQHKLIRKIEGKGFLLSVDLGEEKICKHFVERAIPNGIVTYWFLFNIQSFSIIPPLTISLEEIKVACELILKTLDEVTLIHN